MKNNIFPSFALLKSLKILDRPGPDSCWRLSGHHKHFFFPCQSRIFSDFTTFLSLSNINKNRYFKSVSTYLEGVPLLGSELKIHKDNISLNGESRLVEIVFGSEFRFQNWKKQRQTPIFFAFVAWIQSFIHKNSYLQYIRVKFQN